MEIGDAIRKEKAAAAQDEIQQRLVRLEQKLDELIALMNKKVK